MKKTFILRLDVRPGDDGEHIADYLRLVADHEQGRSVEAGYNEDIQDEHGRTIGRWDIIAQSREWLDRSLEVAFGELEARPDWNLEDVNCFYGYEGRTFDLSIIDHDYDGPCTFLQVELNSTFRGGFRFQFKHNRTGETLYLFPGDIRKQPILYPVGYESAQA